MADKDQVTLAIYLRGRDAQFQMKKMPREEAMGIVKSIKSSDIVDGWMTLDTSKGGQVCFRVADIVYVEIGK